MTKVITRRKLLGTGIKTGVAVVAFRNTGAGFKEVATIYPIRTPIRRPAVSSWRPVGRGTLD